MMFVILAYDVKVRRVHKARKITEKYLQPVQRSVFEGHLTEHTLKRLQGELLNILDCEEESVLIYKQDFNGELTRLQLGSRQMAAGMIL